MKTTRAFFIVLSVPLCLSIFISGCQTQPVKPAAATEVPSEVSLRADRSEVEKYRKDIPEDVKKSNDEVALILSMMSNPDEDPSKVRDRFNTALRKRRETMDKNLRKKRDDFSTTERREREDFLKKAERERAEFGRRSKTTSDQRKRFFEDADLERKEFFASASDKRKTFEATANEERKNFEDYAREKSNQFNQELRAYTTTYYERKKAQGLKKESEKKAGKNPKVSGNSKAGSLTDPSDISSTEPSADPLQEFRQIPKGPPTPLGADTSEQ